MSDQLLNRSALKILSNPRRLGIENVVRSESEPALTIPTTFHKEWKRKLCTESYIAGGPNRISHQQNGTVRTNSRATCTEARLVTRKSCFVRPDQGDRCLNSDEYHGEDHGAAVAKSFGVSGPLINRGPIRWSQGVGTGPWYSLCILTHRESLCKSLRVALQRR